MVTSRYELKIFEWDKQTNKQKNKQIHLIMSKKSVLVYIIAISFFILNTLLNKTVHLLKSL